MGRIPVESTTVTTIRLDGRELLFFGGCNYLGLAQHPAVLDAVRAGIDRYGLTTGSSRETTGNTTVHDELERKLAEFLGFESAILTTEGYTANMAAAAVLARDHRVAIMDERSHRSVRHALTAAGFELHVFPHLDIGKAAGLAREHAAKGVVVVTDGVFTADGTIAPLPQLLDALPRQRAVLVVDDCHGFCVLGRNGRGTCDHFDLHDDRLIVTTTLAKGLGCYGGAIIGARWLNDAVREHSGIYRGTTPCPPPLVMGALAAVHAMETESSLFDDLAANMRRLHEGLVKLGLTPPPGVGGGPRTPIFTFALSPDSRMDELHRSLLDAGIYTALIEYPGGSWARYFRLTTTAAHTVDDVNRLLAQISRFVTSVGASASAA